MLIVFHSTANSNDHHGIAHLKRHTRWSRNLAVVSTISLSSSPLSTNMKIPNTAELFAFFVSISPFKFLPNNIFVSTASPSPLRVGLEYNGLFPNNSVSTLNASFYHRPLVFRKFPTGTVCRPSSARYCI